MEDTRWRCREEDAWPVYPDEPAQRVFHQQLDELF
jgi:hypothetical protein